VSIHPHLLARIIEAARLDIARQEKLVLQLHNEGQPDLAEIAQRHLARTTADLEDLLVLRRKQLLDLRRPKAASQVRTHAPPVPKKRSRL
jgi:hypothetical protein